MNIDSILQPFQHFGVNLGLNRTQKLLSDLGNPQDSIPIIHVAGTNGKGSVCAYLSAILTAAGYNVGRYTSPHLLDWNERICINDQPISRSSLQELLLKVRDAINPTQDSPTQFEVITAAAWLYFAQQQVDIAVIEVGLGGRLDATNVVTDPLVSIITSISIDHWQQLGKTLADIAKEKAGILKYGCPAVIGQLPLAAKSVISQQIADLHCPAFFPMPALNIIPNSLDIQKIQKIAPVYIKEKLLTYPWAEYQGIRYFLPLLGDIQLHNSSLAIAAIQILQQQGWKIPEAAIISGIANTKWLGRLQWTNYKNCPLLIDGAHNPGSAMALREYVDSLDKSPVHWIMGMLSTKDHENIFKALLKKGDQLSLVPVPDNLSANPQDLADLAISICPELESCCIYSDLTSGLDTVILKVQSEDLLILCGSLYLIGHFFKIVNC